MNPDQIKLEISLNISRQVIDLLTTNLANSEFAAKSWKERAEAAEKKLAEIEAEKGCCTQSIAPSA